MKTKLTEAVVEGLTCEPGKQLLCWDTELRGFGVLVSGSSGIKSFVVRGVVNGRDTRLKVCDGGLGLRQARKLAKEMALGFVKGVDPRVRTAANITLEQALESYLKKKRLRPHSVSTYSKHFKVHFHDWSKRNVASITTKMVEDRFRDISAEVAARSAAKIKHDVEIWERRARETDRTKHPEAHARYVANAEAARARKPDSGETSANSALRTLKAVLNSVEGMDNPVRLKKGELHKERRRTRILKEADMPQFWQALQSLDSPVGRDFLTVLLFTGTRVGELASLRWESVDFAAKTITLQAADTKSDESLALPMTDMVHAALVRRRAIGRDKYVFPADSASGHIVAPKHFLGLIRAATGIRLAPHDFRRTYITACEMCDVSPHAQRLLVNHAVPKDVHGGYIQYPAAKLRTVAQRVADYLKTLCGIEEPAGENVSKMLG
jgi:integrase